MKAMYSGSVILPIGFDDDIFAVWDERLYNVGIWLNSCCPEQLNWDK